jgi:hypothetical protein
MNFRCLLIKRRVPDDDNALDTTAFILTPETTLAQINDIIEWYSKGTLLISVELTYHYTTATAMVEVEKFKSLMP